MKVKDLLKQLANFDQDAEIQVMIQKPSGEEKIYGKENILITVTKTDEGALISIYESDEE